MKSRFLDDPDELDLLPIGVDRQIQAMSRLVGNAAVQRVLELARRIVKLRRPVALQAAPRKQFIKAVEPAQAARLSQIDKCRVHRAANRGLPADQLPTLRSLKMCTPNAHAAGW